MSRDTAFEICLSSAWVTFFPDFTVQTDRNMYISKKHSCEQVLSLGKHRKRVKLKINVPYVWMETERETGWDGEWERAKQVGKLFICLPTKTIHQGFLENPLLTCAALTFISIFLRASDQANLFICMWYLFYPKRFKVFSGVYHNVTYSVVSGVGKDIL